MIKFADNKIVIEDVPELEEMLPSYFMRSDFNKFIASIKQYSFYSLDGCVAFQSDNAQNGAGDMLELKHGEIRQPNLNDVLKIKTHDGVSCPFNEEHNNYDPLNYVEKTTKVTALGKQVPYLGFSPWKMKHSPMQAN